MHIHSVYSTLSMFIRNPPIHTFNISSELQRRHLNTSLQLYVLQVERTFVLFLLNELYCRRNKNVSYTYSYILHNAYVKNISMKRVFFSTFYFESKFLFAWENHCSSYFIFLSKTWLL